MILDIVQIPNEILLTQTKEVSLDEIKSSEMKTLIENMIETCIENNGVGLAANQVGIDKSLFIYKKPGEDIFNAVFNPKIIKKKFVMNHKGEMCLSIKDKSFNIKRYKKITLEGFDQEGSPILIETKSKKVSVILQHEVDHLSGITILNRR